MDYDDEEVSDTMLLIRYLMKIAVFFALILAGISVIGAISSEYSMRFTPCDNMGHWKALDIPARCAFMYE